ncbi:MAG TPA: nicotinate (nicotinamide) nucleotide adenylyltransferase [Acidobacteriota bacterium]|nr:nicotinate (nicotinamide) nucleotide adenylyltransferase [Acidobacteriota bacterium]
MNVGILGGSFDPIHQGHVYVARRLLEIFDLDEVWFMVANVPPHKEKKTLAGPYHRYAMTVLALKEEPRLVACTWELERKTPSFTIETLDSLVRERPADRFCFIAGSDSLRDLHSWKDYDKLLLEHCCVFIQRSGSHVDIAELALPEALKEVIQPIYSDTRCEIQPGHSFLINLNPPAISSTEIRETIAEGGTPSPDSLSPAVLAYIRKYRLYEKNPKNPNNPQESLRDH